MNRKMNFVVQQGLSVPAGEACSITYSALMFQPKVVAVLAVAGTVLQSRVVYGVLAVVLWWGAVAPRWNVFDGVYNRWFRRETGVRLERAMPPRRFAQGLAGTFCAAIAVLLSIGMTTISISIQLLFLAAIAALVFGGFCFGSYVFHLVTRRRLLKLEPHP